MSRPKGKAPKKPRGIPRLGFDHHCSWRDASRKLASCVVAVLLTDGKIGIGSGLVMKRKHGKITLERWDKDFREALAFVGIEVVDKPTAGKPIRKPGQRGAPIARDRSEPYRRKQSDAQGRRASQKR